MLRLLFEEPSKSSTTEDNLDKHLCLQKNGICLFVYEWEVNDFKLLTCLPSDNEGYLVWGPALKIDTNSYDGLQLVLGFDCVKRNIVQACVIFRKLNDRDSKYQSIVKGIPSGFSFKDRYTEIKCRENKNSKTSPSFHISCIRLEFLDFNRKVLDYLIFFPENVEKYFAWKPKNDISKYVERGSLNLRLKVTVQRRDNYSTSEMSTSMNTKNKLNLCRDLEDLSLGNHSPDLNIKIGKKQFMVHQCIVLTQFKFLSKLLSEVENISSDTEKEVNQSVKGVTSISIPSMDPEIFEVILCYIYSGKLDIERKIDYSGLFDFAQKYQFFELCRNLKPQKMHAKSQITKNLENFSWKVTDISMKMREKFVFHQSPEFKTSDGAVWCIVLYFLNKDSISLSLKNLTTGNVGAHTYFRLIVYNPDETLCEQHEFCHMFWNRQSNNVLSPGSNSGFGVPVNAVVLKGPFHVLLKTFRISPELLFDDTLCVGCEITVCKSLQTSKTQEVQTHFHATNEQPDFKFKVWLRNLQRLLDYGVYSDITLTVADTDFKVHKAILSARSPVFATMFKTSMSEKINRHVKIEDIRSSTLKYLLQYIYTGTLDSLTPLTIKEAPELYRAADKYEVLQLKEEVSKFISENLDPEHACEVLMLADLYKEEEMMRMAVDTICRNASLSLLSDQGQELMMNHVQLASEVFDRLSEAYRIESVSYLFN